MSQTNNPCETCGQVCTAGGCKAWQDWWIQNWNDNIHRNVPTVPKQVYQYEHPDRVREMAPKKPEEMPRNTLRSGRHNPCQGCPDRYTACSGHCVKPDFQAWQADQETIRRNRAAYNGLNNYVFRQSERNSRARK